VDVLSPDLITDAFFDFKRDERLMEVLNEPNSNYSEHNILIPAIQEMGFNSFNAIKNLQGLINVFLIIAAEYVLLGVAIALLYLLYAIKNIARTNEEGGGKITICAKAIQKKLYPHIINLKRSMVYR
jgi:hypothetical protein